MNFLNCRINATGSKPDLKNLNGKKVLLTHHPHQYPPPPAHQNSQTLHKVQIKRHFQLHRYRDPVEQKMRRARSLWRLFMARTNALLLWLPDKRR